MKSKSMRSAWLFAILYTVTALYFVRPADGATVAPTKVLTIVEENHGYTQAKAGMPYLMSLANKYAYASNYHATRHPSLPNYIAIVGGDTFGVTTDKEPVPSPHIGQNHSVFGQAIIKGLKAKLYNESMKSNCSNVWGGGYAGKHNPWLYFGSEVAQCKSFDVPDTTFLSDAKANALPNAGMLVPNQANDAHNGSLATADNWLKARLPTVLASSDFTSGRLTVVVTFDEDGGTSANTVLTVVMNAGMTKHGVVTTNLTHYSLTGYYEHVLGVPLLRNAATGFNTAFGLQ
jgi:phospholipase C